ncbi:MAG: undecaprenyl diphosphate synthase family protein, partial [Actinomyces graevenitzii]|nr:undecaprenyl diphosphate synthase family protein [Actinomyces graevenitzii]
MAGDNLLYDVYERRLLAQLDRSKVPAHVGVILDGNRRWAKSLGVGAAHGPRRGADKIAEFLGWAENAGVEIVTLWLLSTDNLSRDPQELAPLLDIIASAVENLASARRWRLRIVGSVELLPQPVAQRLLAAVESTSAIEGMEVNVAVGYGGREE